MTLWALLLAGWGCAGAFETAPGAVRPVQLSLELPQSASATRFEAIEAISQIPGAAQPAALVPSAMPEAVAAALRGGDAVAFHAAVNQAAEATGYSLPDSDEQAKALYDDGAARAQAEQQFHDAVADNVSPRAKKKRAAKRKTKIDYDAFGRALLEYPGLSNDIRQHAEAKRDILRKAGYTRLYGKGKSRVSVDEASDERVGSAFEKTLAAYRRR